MRVRLAALALVVTVGGCTKWMYGYVLFPDSRRPSSVGLAIVEANQGTIDGPDLDFRLLVGAVDGGVSLDRRLVPSWTLVVTGAQDCDSGEPVPYYFADYLQKDDPQSLVEIRPGEWFGKEVRFPLVEEAKDGGAPACLEATFTLNLELALNPHVPFRVRGYRSAPRGEEDAGQP